MTSLMQDGTMNEAALCSQQLDRLYGPLREQVAQSLKRQDTVLRQLKVARSVNSLINSLIFVYLFITFCIASSVVPYHLV